MYISVDSTNRDTALYPNGNAYVMYLSSSIPVIHSIKVINAKVPNTMYNLTNGSNCFTFNSNAYSLNTGFYSALGLASAIASTTGNALSCTYLSDIGKFIFYSTSSFTLTSFTTEMKKLLGLTSASYTSVLGSTLAVYSNDPVYSAKYIVLSNIVVNLNMNENIFLDIEEFREPSIRDAKSLNSSYSASGSIGIERVSAIIPIDVDSGKVKIFKENTDFTILKVFGSPILNIRKLTIQWVDSQGRVLNFNGYDTNSFVIEYE